LLAAAWVSLLWLAPGPTAAGADDDADFPVRPWDEIVTRDHRFLRGRIRETGDKSRVEIELHQTGVIQSLDRSEIQELRPRARAEEAVERGLKEHPDRLGPLARKALRLFAGNRAAEAVVLKALEGAAPAGDPDVLALLAERYLATGEAIAAEKAARTLVRSRDSHVAQMLLGQALASQGKDQEADAALEKALRLAPEDETVMIARAEFLLSVGRVPQALKIFADALAKNPRSLPALVGQGFVALRQGELDAAMDSFDRALAGEAKPLRARLGLAACKALKKDFVEAARYANNVLNTDPNHAEAFALLAYVRLLQGGEEEKQALCKIEDALKSNPNEPRF
jgi:Tfp pilus assembly protein PilF